MDVCNELDSTLNGGPGMFSPKEQKLTLLPTTIQTKLNHAKKYNFILYSQMLLRNCALFKLTQAIRKLSL